jgi:hypothetical protein
MSLHNTMEFYEYFEACSTMNKEEECPDGCELKEGFPDIPPIWIPPPQKPDQFVGLLISRDPTTDFMPVYCCAKTKYASSPRAYMFKSNAIPRWLCDRIAEFNKEYMENQLSPSEFDTIRRTLFDHVYWTHLHKCCTNKCEVGSLPFKKTNAHLCADRWLKTEIKHASRENIAFIITLGRDVEYWFEINWSEFNVPSSTIRLCHLPHPSRANMASWHPKDDKARSNLEKKIRKLVEQFKELEERTG